MLIGFKMTPLIWIIVSTSFSTVLSLISLFTIAVTKKMRNLQGFICSCYLASYIGCMIVSTKYGLALQFREYSRYYYGALMIEDLGYFVSATFLWLNVMSFDIWTTFRKLRSNPNADAIRHSDLKFVHYSIYSWGSSLVLHVAFVICGIASPICQFYALGVGLILMIGVTISTICFLIATALIIKQHKRETAGSVDRFDELYQENIQWFICYVGLFVLTILTLILLIIAEFSTEFLLPLLGPLQSILSLVIFISRVEVRRSLREIFQRSSPTVVQTLQTDDGRL